MSADRLFGALGGVPAEDDDGAAAELLHGCEHGDALLCKVVLSERGPGVVGPETWAAVINGGHVEIAQLLVHAGSCLRSSQAQGRSPLSLAAELGHVELCEYLLQATKAHECNACRSSVAETRSSALLVAAGQGHLSLCETLVEGSANDQLLTKAVRVASEHGHLQVRDSLLQCLGHDLKTVGADGRMALHRAAELGHAEACRLLVQEAGCEGRADGQGSTPLHLAAAQGHRQVCEILLQGQGQGLPLQKQNSSGHAAAAVKTTSASAVAAATYPGSVADSDGRLPLHRAAERGHAEICRLLLTRPSPCPSPWPCPSPTRGQEAEQGQVQWQGTLHMLGRPDSEGWTPLHLAAAAGHRRTCEVLLQLRVQAEQAAQKAQAALKRPQGGLRRPSQPLTQSLLLPLPLPVSSDRSDRDGGSPPASASAPTSTSASASASSTPLHVAAGQGHVEVCELLLLHERSRPDPQGRRQGQRHVQWEGQGRMQGQGQRQREGQGQGRGQGSSPVLAAALAPLPPVPAATPPAPDSEPDPHVLQLLHARDAKARMPLHEAAEAGHLQICQLLVKHGALLEAVSRDGTPLACAERSETAEAAEVAAYLRNQIDSIWATRGGSGDAWRAAIADQRDVFEIEWHCKLLPGPLGLLGGRHSAIVAWMDTSSGSGIGFLTAYCIEKAQPEKLAAPVVSSVDHDHGDDSANTKDAPHCPNGVFVSSWLQTQGAFEEKRHVLANRQLQKRIRLAHLRDLAISLGPYDPIKCNCHHAAMALYNRCAAASHLRVLHSPSHMLEGITWMVPESMRDFFATTQAKPVSASESEPPAATTPSSLCTSVCESEPTSATATTSTPSSSSSPTHTHSPSATRVTPALPLPPVLSCDEEVAFRGRVLLQEGVDCVVSLPGKFARAWTALVKTSLGQGQGGSKGKSKSVGMGASTSTWLSVSMACVFMCSPLDGLGQHALDPEHPGDCYCRTIYGDRGRGTGPGKEQGWHRLGYLLTYPAGDVQKERRQREKAQCCQAAVVVEGADAATQRRAEVEAEAKYEENERRASWGCAWFHRWKVNIEIARKNQQKLVVYYFPFQVGLGEVPWEDLKNPEVNLWDDLGLGASQKCEVAHLERMGYPYEKRDVRTLQTQLKQLEGVAAVP